MTECTACLSTERKIVTLDVQGMGPSPVSVCANCYTEPPTFAAFRVSSRAALRNAAEYVAVIDNALKERDALRARIETLEAALEPFDDALGEDDEFADDTPITAKWGRTTYYALTLGDLRRARHARNALGRKG